MKIKYLGNKKIIENTVDGNKLIENDDVFEIKDSEIKNYVNRQHFQIIQNQTKQKKKKL